MDLDPRSATERADTGYRARELGTDDLMRLPERDVEQFALLQVNLGREIWR